MNTFRSSRYAYIVSITLASHSTQFELSDKTSHDQRPRLYLRATPPPSAVHGNFPYLSMRSDTPADARSRRAVRVVRVAQPRTRGNKIAPTSSSCCLLSKIHCLTCILGCSFLVLVLCVGMRWRRQSRVASILALHVGTRRDAEHDGRRRSFDRRFVISDKKQCSPKRKRCLKDEQIPVRCSAVCGW